MVLIKELDLGARLAAQLRKRQLANPIVIAMSSGGIRLAWELARDLQLSMDVLITLEIVVPGYRQVRIGAVAGNTFLADQTVLDSEGLPADYVERLAARGMRRQEEVDRVFRRRQPPLTIPESGVVLVDNGWSSPVAVQAAVEALRQRGAAEIIYATPICGDETYERIRGKVSIVSLYPRNARHSVLVGNRSLATVTIDEAATWIEASRGFGKRSKLPSLMERRSIFNAASPVTRVVESHSR
jgi:predicted phosphoribosyltransferase